MSRIGPPSSRIGVSMRAFENLPEEEKENLRENLRQKNLKRIEEKGEADGLAGVPMNKDILERTGESPYSTKTAQSYSTGYVRGRETRGKGRNKKKGKKSGRKTRRAKLLHRKL